MKNYYFKLLVCLALPIFLQATPPTTPNYEESYCLAMQEESLPSKPESYDTSVSFLNHYFWSVDPIKFPIFVLEKRQELAQYTDGHKGILQLFDQIADNLFFDSFDENESLLTTLSTLNYVAKQSTDPQLTFDAAVIVYLLVRDAEIYSPDILNAALTYQFFEKKQISSEEIVNITSKETLAILNKITSKEKKTPRSLFSQKNSSQDFSILLAHSLYELLSIKDFEQNPIAYHSLIEKTDKLMAQFKGSSLSLEFSLNKALHR